MEASVSRFILDRSLGLVTANIITCIAGEEVLNSHIAEEQVGQALHKLFSLGVDYVIYMSTTNIGIVYIVVVKCHGNKIDE